MELLDLYDENKHLTNLQISRGVKVPKGYYRLVVHRFAGLSLDFVFC